MIPRGAVEIGMGQAKDVADMLMTSDLISRTEVWLDQYDVKRTVVGYSRYQVVRHLCNSGLNHCCLAKRTFSCFT